MSLQDSVASARSSKRILVLVFRYFVVDTGASSLIIAPQKVATLYIFLIENFGGSSSSIKTRNHKETLRPSAFITVTLGCDGNRSWKLEITRKLPSNSCVHFSVVSQKMTYLQARELGLSTFGEVYIFGVNGVVR